MKLNELLRRIRTWWNDCWGKHEEEMRRWRKEDPGGFYAYMNGYYRNPPYL